MFSPGDFKALSFYNKIVSIIKLLGVLLSLSFDLCKKGLFCQINI